MTTIVLKESPSLVLKEDEQILRLDTIAVSGASGASSLPDLLDVSFAAPAVLGDLFTRGATEWNRLPIGTSAQVLTVVGGVPTWADIPTQSVALDDLTDVTFSGPIAAGDIFTFIGGAWDRLPIGADGDRLSVSAGALTWEAPVRELDDLSDVVTAGAQPEDLLVRGASMWTGLGIGSNGDVLTVVGGSIAWAAPALSATDLQSAYDGGNTIALTTGVPVAITATAADQNAISIVEGRLDMPRQMAIGEGASTGGSTDGIAIGYFAEATENRAIAIGPGVDAFAVEAIAIGSGIVNEGTSAVAIGADHTIGVTHLDAVAIGRLVVPSGPRSIGIGLDVTPGQQSIAMGYQATATGLNSIAIGPQAGEGGGLAVTAEDAIAIGRASEASGISGTALGTQASVGPNAGAVAIGALASAGATSDDGVAVGVAAVADGLAGVAVGRNASATATRGVAVGPGASAVGSATVAIGWASSSSSTDGVAVGAGASAGARALALGRSMVAVNNEGVIGSAAGIPNFWFGKGKEDATPDPTVTLHATDASAGSATVGSNLGLQGGESDLGLPGAIELLSPVLANAARGTAGQVLTSRGDSLSPEWTTVGGGGVGIGAVVAVNAATYAVQDDEDFIIVDYSTTGVCTITLPAISGHETKRIVVKDRGRNASNFNIVIRPNGAETIDGLDEYILTQDNDSITFVGQGGEWSTI